MKPITSIRALLILLLTLSVTACGGPDPDEVFEDYFFQYNANVNRALENFAANLPETLSLEDMLALHQQTLGNLKRIRARFLQENTDEQAHRVIELCDFAITGIIEYNNKLLELSAPIRKSQTQRLHDFKDSTRYAQQLAGLELFLDELNKAEQHLNTHHEKVRKRLLATGLGSEQRKLVWPPLNRFIRTYTVAQTRYLSTLTFKVTMEIAVTRFLHEHKDDYSIDDRAIPLFSSDAAYNAFIDLRKKVQREYEQAHKQI